MFTRQIQFKNIKLHVRTKFQLQINLISNHIQMDKGLHYKECSVIKMDVAINKIVIDR